MSHFLTMSIVSLSLSFGAFAADKPAPKAECTCAAHGEKCSGGCCSACSGEKGGACSCKTEGCKSCPVCKGKHAH